MLRDSAIYIASRAVPSALGFVTGMALTWLLTPADYGVYGLGLAMVTLLSAIFFDWHALSFMRFYQANAESPSFMPTVALTFGMLCLASAILAAAVVPTGLLPPDYRLLTWIALPGCWAFAWFELAARVQVARFRPMSYFWMNLARNLLILGLGVAAAWFWRSAYPVLAASFLSMFIAALAFHPSGIRLAPSLFDRGLAMRLVAFGWAMALVRALGGTSFAIDRVLLESLNGRDAVGFYTVAYALAQTTIATIGAGVGSATYSLAVRAVEAGDTAALRGQLSRNCALLLALLMPSALGAAVVAPALARICVSPAYVVPVAGLIPWMAASAFCYGFRANYFDHAFQLGHDTKRLVVVIAVISAVNLALDLLLIPRFGYLGAAAASLSAGAVGLAHGWWAGRRVLAMPFPVRDAGKIAAASAAMMLFLWPLHAATGSGVLAVEVLGGAMVYGALLLALDGIGLRGALRAWLLRRA